MLLRMYVACSSDPVDYEEARALGASGILTNSNLLLKCYGEEMTLKELAQKMLDESKDMTVFQAIHGRTCEEIVRKALDIYNINPEILAASIHNAEEAKTAFLAGADAIAAYINTLKAMCNDPLNLQTEKSFGAAFDK